MIGGRSHRRSTNALCVAVLSALTCGCGASASPPHRVVSVSVIAPTDGATVSVRAIAVLGDVTPRDATVLVSGRRARVTGGVFRLALRLRRRTTHIRIIARASGYAGAATAITVRYRHPRRVRQPDADRKSTRLNS